MDKFDQSIVEAKEVITPSSNFVNNTINKIDENKPKKRWNIKVWVPILVGSLAVIALVLVTLNLGSSKPTNNSNKAVATTTSTQPTTTTQTASNLPSGTDNATLASDLNNINSSIGQENSDQANANNGLNDISQQITVPTN